MSNRGRENRITRLTIIAIASVGVVLAAVIYLGSLPKTTKLASRNESHPANVNAVESPATTSHTTTSLAAPTNAATDTNQRLLTQAELDAGRLIASAPMEAFDSQEAFEKWVASLLADDSHITLPSQVGHVQIIIPTRTPTIVVDQNDAPHFERWPMMDARRGATWGPEVIGAPGNPACWPLPHCDVD